MSRKIQPCLWFDKNAEEAANFYAETFPNSRIDSIERAPGDYPSGKAGDVLVITMTILG
ncbi:MAG TPA: VOC family protein, partial [Sphingomicrobium sp.]|nr:VOC family protein [Sphingomicrobium sp.]